MRKLIWMVLFAFCCGAGQAFSEPISFDQAANVTGLTGIEVGFDFDYSYEKVEQQVLDAVEASVTDIPIFVRLGLPIMEIKLSMPYGSLSSNVASAVNNDFSGIRNIGLGLKGGLLALPVFNVALGLNTVFPTAEPEKYIFGDGLSLDPFLAVGLDLMVIKLHGNIGYEYRAGYNLDYNPFTMSTNEAVAVKPGDATHYALGVEIPTSDSFFLMAELLGTSYGEVKIAEVAVPDTSGMTLQFVPGVRLKAGLFNAKLGVAIPLENQDDRPELAPRADWRILGGASLRFGL